MSKSKEKDSDTIKMTRDGIEADVHIEEVENYKRGGWVEA